jgi:hypothetical protein
MNELGILLAWMIIPSACFMVFYAVRDILNSGTELALQSTLHHKAFHRNRTVS